jgi:hypothetical protein
MRPPKDGSRRRHHCAAHVQAALVMFDVQTERAPKQRTLRTLTSRLAMEAMSSSKVVRWSSRGRSADSYPVPA